MIAASGTAYAVAASKVNIADPTTPSQVAKVDPSGHLLTNGSTSTINSDIAAYGFNSPSVYLATSLTHATLAISAVDVDNSHNNFEPNSDFEATLVKIQVGSSGTCTDTDRLVTALSSYAARSGQSTSQSFPAPIVVKSDASKAYCLGFQLTLIDATAGATLYPTDMTLDAYVVAGAYAGAGTNATPAHALPTALRHA
ncbi:MAG TPA: hypothetical protein VGI86_20230 [Acidimicrobiia bacterium]